MVILGSLWILHASLRSSELGVGTSSLAHKGLLGKMKERWKTNKWKKIVGIH